MVYSKGLGMITSYHVHSTYSDGKTGIREMVAGAVTQGIDELGISDHYVWLGNGDLPVWSMPLDALPRYLAEIGETAEEFGGELVVRKGLEADYDPATERELGEALRQFPFDYVIGSVHFLDGFPVDEDSDHWDMLSEAERNDMYRLYWDRIRLMAKSRLFDFAGHLDLYKKFGHRPTIDISGQVETALDAIAESGMAVEVNTAGLFLPAGEAYPSSAILPACHTRGIPILINSDAHKPADLLRGFDDGRRLARAAGYTHAAAFAQRSARSVPLP